MRIGERVLRLADEKGVKKTDLAQKLGVGKSTVTGWEQPNRNPSSDLIVPICEILEVSEHYLLTGEDNGYVYDEKVKALIDVIEKLDERGYTVVMGTAYNELSRVEQKLTISSLDRKKEIGDKSMVHSEKGTAAVVNSQNKPKRKAE